MIPSIKIMQLPEYSGDLRDVYTMATNEHNQSVKLNCNAVIQVIQQAIDHVNNNTSELNGLRSDKTLLTAYKDWSRNILDSHNVCVEFCNEHDVEPNSSTGTAHQVFHKHIDKGHKYYCVASFYTYQNFLDLYPESHTDAYLCNGSTDNIYAHYYNAPSSSHSQICEFFFEAPETTDNCVFTIENVTNQGLVSPWQGNFLHMNYCRLYDLSVAPTETLQNLHDQIQAKDNEITVLNSQVSTLTTERNKWKKMYEDHMSTHSSSGGGTSGGGTTTTGKWYIKCYDCGYEWGPFNSEADARTKEQLLNSDLGKIDMCDGNHSGDEGYTHSITYVYNK